MHFSGGLSEREEKVSLDLTEEILQSMEVGMAFRDYVRRFIVSFVNSLYLLIYPKRRREFL